MEQKTAYEDDCHTRLRVHDADAPGIIVFAPVLLPYSQTFIRSHVQSLSRFRPVLAGLQRTDGLDLANVETAIVARSRLQRLLLYFGGYSRELDELVQQHRASLVHCHFADGGSLLAAYCKRRHIPLVVTLHGSDVLRHRASPLASFLRSRLLSKAVQSAALFLPVSDWLRREATRRNFPEDRCRTHYLGIPLDPPSPERRANEVVTILYVGRLVEKKGLPYLVDAVSQLAGSDRHFEVRIVGSGPLRTNAEARSNTVNLPIKFLGALAPEQVRAEMDRADIFCLPSTVAADGDNEGLGLVLIEAQSRSLPVVAFDQGPIPEAVANGTSGILVADKDASALAGALALLIDDPDGRHKMGQAGRRLVEERFDIAKQTLQLEALYAGLLAKRTPTERSTGRAA